MKTPYTIERLINSDIKLGDQVKIIDGSGVSCDSYERDVYIIFAYPDITNSQEPLHNLNFVVSKTGIDDRVISGVLGGAYLQDLELEYNGHTFRTPSQFVKKIDAAA